MLLIENIMNPSKEEQLEWVFFVRKKWCLKLLIFHAGDAEQDDSSELTLDIRNSIIVQRTAVEP